MKIRATTIVFVSFIACLFTVSCGARRERAELVEFAKMVETNKPQSIALINNFTGLQNLKGVNDPNIIAQTIAKVAIDINTFITPFKEMKIKSKEVGRLRDEYVTMYTSIQEILRMTLEVMATGDPRLAASLNDRLTKTNALYQTSAQRFDTDYDILLKRYAVSSSEIVALPQNPQVGGAPSPTMPASLLQPAPMSPQETPPPAPQPLTAGANVK